MSHGYLRVTCALPCDFVSMINGMVAQDVSPSLREDLLKNCFASSKGSNHRFQRGILNWGKLGTLLAQCYV